MNSYKVNLIVFIMLLNGVLSAQNEETQIIEKNGLSTLVTAKDNIDYGDQYKGTTSEKAEAFYIKAIDASNANDKDNAIKFYEKAIKQDPKFVEAYDNLGRVYRSIGNLEKAEFYYNKSLEIFPKGPFALMNLAVVHRINGDLIEALKLYESLTMFHPENPEGYFGLASTGMLLERYRLASENIDEAIRIYEAENNDYLGQAYYIKGVALIGLDEIEEAAPFIKKAQDRGMEIDDETMAVLYEAETNLEEMEETSTDEDGEDGNQLFKTAQDYRDFEEKYVMISDWILNTPVGTDKETRDAYSGILVIWMTGAPDVTLELSDKNLPYMENPEMMIAFFAAYGRYAINNPKADAVETNVAATKDVIKFYNENKRKLGKAKGIDELIKLDKKGKLKAYFKE